MSNKTTVNFIVYDYPNDLNEITSILGLKPTEIQDNNENPSDSRRWVLGSGVDESKDLEDHLVALTNQLLDNIDGLKQIVGKARCVISAGIEYYEYNPEIAFTPEMLNTLSTIGVKLWLDIYNMEDEHGEQPYSGKGKLEG